MVFEEISAIKEMSRDLHWDSRNDTFSPKFSGIGETPQVIGSRV
jgi:hypothetical protein